MAQVDRLIDFTTWALSTGAIYTSAREMPQ